MLDSNFCTFFVSLWLISLITIYFLFFKKGMANYIFSSFTNKYSIGKKKSTFKS